MFLWLFWRWLIITAEEKLSETIVNHSLKIKEKEKVLITYQANEARNLVESLVKEILKKKAVPTIKFIDPEISNLIKESLTDEIIENKKNIFKFEVNEYDAFIQIRYTTREVARKHLGKSNSMIR